MAFNLKTFTFCLCFSYLRLAFSEITDADRAFKASEEARLKIVNSGDAALRSVRDMVKTIRVAGDVHHDPETLHKARAAYKAIQDSERVPVQVSIT